MCESNPKLSENLSAERNLSVWRIVRLLKDRLILIWQVVECPAVLPVKGGQVDVFLVERHQSQEQDLSVHRPVDRGSLLERGGGHVTLLVS